MVQDGGLRGNRRPTNRPEAAHGDPDELRVCQVRQDAVVPEYWEISTPCDFFRVFLLLNTISGYAHDMIVLERQLNRLLQRDAVRLSRLFPLFCGALPIREAELPITQGRLAQQRHEKKRCNTRPGDKMESVDEAQGIRLQANAGTD